MKSVFLKFKKLLQEFRMQKVLQSMNHNLPTFVEMWKLTMSDLPKTITLVDLVCLAVVMEILDYEAIATYTIT